MTIKQAAKEMLDNLERKKRSNGDDYICNKESIAWQEEIIHAAHGDKLPDDYTYQFIYEALCAIVDAADGEEDDAIYAIEPDIYTSGLTAWLASRNDRLEYLTQAIEEGAKDNALAWAQSIEIREVAEAVLNGIRKYIEE